MKEFFLGVWLIGCGPEPKLPIQGLRINGSFGPVSLIVLPPVGPHLYDTAQTAGLNQINGILKMPPTALLHSTLQDLFTGTDGASQNGAFLKRVGDRFLEVYILPCFERVECHGDMPVIRRSNDHGIDVLGEDLAIIQVSSCKAVGALLDSVTTRSIDVADCHNFIGAGIISGIEKPFHALARANYAETQSVVCPKNPG